MSKTYNTLALKNLAVYISGYSDGEGCFCVSFSRRPKNIKVGWEVKPSFAVGQNFDRHEVLDLMQTYFDCGFIRRDYSDKTLKYEVRSIDDLISKIIPHFKKYPIISSKKKDFTIFSKICSLIKTESHLKKTGLIKIIKLAYKMNGSGKRRYTEKELLSFLR